MKLIHNSQQCISTHHLWGGLKLKSAPSPPPPTSWQIRSGGDILSSEWVLGEIFADCEYDYYGVSCVICSVHSAYKGPISGDLYVVADAYDTVFNLTWIVLNTIPTCLQSIIYLHEAVFTYVLAQIPLRTSPLMHIPRLFLVRKMC